MNKRTILRSAASELMRYIECRNTELASLIRSTDMSPPDYHDFQTCQELNVIAESLKWISVDERLPDEGVTVNVLMDHKGEKEVDVGAVYTHVPTWDEISTVPYQFWDHPINDGQDWAHDLITHWTPILELP